MSEQLFRLELTTERHEARLNGQDRRLDTIETDIHDLHEAHVTTKLDVARIGTRVGIYAALGAGAAGVVSSVISAVAVYLIVHSGGSS